MTTTTETTVKDNWDFPKDLLEFAWIIIANSHEGNWEKEPQEWQDAAAKWRDAYFQSLKRYQQS